MLSDFRFSAADLVDVVSLMFCAPDGVEERDGYKKADLKVCY